MKTEMRTTNGTYQLSTLTPYGVTKSWWWLWFFAWGDNFYVTPLEP